MNVKLTRRQTQVVRLTSLGLTMDEIAVVLNISYGTVDQHRSRAMKQLGISRATMLTRFAIQNDISPLGDKLSAEENARLQWQSQK